MAEGLGSAGANTALNALVVAYPWVKLHIGAPGSAGTSNPAVETTRKAAVFSAASGGAITNTNLPTWPAVAASETYTHFSLWSASTGGSFGASGTVTAAAMTAGGNFQVPIGDLDITFTLAS